MHKCYSDRNWQCFTRSLHLCNFSSGIRRLRVKRLLRSRGGCRAKSRIFRARSGRKCGRICRTARKNHCGISFCRRWGRWTMLKLFVFSYVCIPFKFCRRRRRRENIFPCFRALLYHTFCKKGKPRSQISTRILLTFPHFVLSCTLPVILSQQN